MLEMRSPGTDYCLSPYYVLQTLFQTLGSKDKTVCAFT